jgi:hypothetical protein
MNWLRMDTCEVERSRRILTHYDIAKLMISIESSANSPVVETRGYQWNWSELCLLFS